MMHTLLDPFEIASREVPAPVAMASQVELDVRFEDDSTPSLPASPGPDSSGRLRCWCSED
jgi:hypothetical protein